MPADRVRASDDEREDAVASLRAAAALGRLSIDSSPSAPRRRTRRPRAASWPDCSTICRTNCPRSVRGEAAADPGRFGFSALARPGAVARGGSGSTRVRRAAADGVRLPARRALRGSARVRTRHPPGLDLPRRGLRVPDRPVRAPVHQRGAHPRFSSSLAATRPSSWRRASRRCGSGRRSRCWSRDDLPGPASGNAPPPVRPSCSGSGKRNSNTSHGANERQRATRRTVRVVLLAENASQTTRLRPTSAAVPQTWHGQPHLPRCCRSLAPRAVRRQLEP